MDICKYCRQWLSHKFCETLCDTRCMLSYFCQGDYGIENNCDHSVADLLKLVSAFCTYCVVGGVVNAFVDQGGEDVDHQKEF